MTIIYIAGPFRASNNWDRENNIRRAEALALEVWRAGFAALCPHTNTRFFDGAAPDEVWLAGDLAMLSRCDGLLTTADWMDSRGASAEVAFAKDNQIPVFHTLSAVISYFENACPHCGYLNGFHAAWCADAFGN